MIAFSREWAMPSKDTFTIPPIAALIKRHRCTGGLYWVDPFAGFHSPAIITNDLNPEAPTRFHLDALDFLRTRDIAEFDGGFFDPVYSKRQASECYKQFGLAECASRVTRADYWSSCKDELARIIKPGGLSICFGWDSNGLGKGRGFELLEILLVAHGGLHYDTIVTVERKVQTMLSEVTS